MGFWVDAEGHEPALPSCDYVAVSSQGAQDHFGAKSANWLAD